MNFRRHAPLWVVAAAVLASYQVTSSQVLSYSRGQTVSPAFEGWEEELDVPIWPDNNISPGLPDQGQPTHFLPRRNRFVFAVRVPEYFGKKELVWTLTTKGKPLTLIAYAKDDGVPRPRFGPGSLAAERVARATNTTPPAVGTVAFDRAGANSPWAWRWMAPAIPPDGKYVVNVHFDDPGTYTIRCMASDGALNTPKDVVVTVK